MKALKAAVTLLVLSLTLPSTAAAQGGYFGRNKVQYQEFDFQVLKTEHFDIYYYPEEAAAAQMASRMAERWYARLSEIFDHDLRGRQPLILYASGPHFRQTNAIQGDIGEGTGGVTEAYKRRIVLPFAGPIEATDHVLGHELVHAFQYDITGTNVSGNTAGALGLPLWFIEGMAEYLSIGPVDPHTAMWMREAARREHLPTIDELDNPRYFPYRYGHAFWAYVAGRYGDRIVGTMLRAAGGRDSSYKVAIEGILKTDTKTLSQEWHAAEFEAYGAMAETTKMPGAIARAVIPTEKQGRMNVSPELSPDGSRMIFFSERDLFSIDLYLADAKTGEVIRKITDTATDGHYESLQFLTSAGAWDKAGKRVVFPGISGGDPVLAIVNVENGKKEREIKIRDVQEILNPAWSPDDRYIAFSGLVGGFNDLFVYDLQSDTLRRLTNDAFADMDPDWSPDGRSIAFATDRFTTDLEKISAGHLRIALVDVANGNIREVGGFQGAKNISPQFGDDASTLYFLSDRGGVTNVYRLNLDNARTTQITNLLTGASGITELSPALSVGQGRVAFSAYEDDGYSIYALETPEQLAGVAPVDLPVNAAVLPPRRKGEGQVFTLLNSEVAGLPPAAETIAEPEPYRPRFSLDFAGQPSFGVGVDPFGTYAAGGIAFLFSDMLGNHTLGTSAQVTSRFDEFGGTLFYLNRTHRWNWGAAIEQIPYVARGFEAGVVNVDGTPVYLERELRVLQRDQTVAGMASYPFSRNLRVEFTGGYRRIGLSQDVTSRFFSLETGQQIDEIEEDLGGFDPLSLGEASGALVFDSSLFGLTSPILGSRARLEFSQSAGDLTYSGVLADMRTYFMPIRPYTLAFRGMYYGRFGRDAEDGRLPTLFLGYPGLVRGYDSTSFETGECGNQPDGSCPSFDRLVGSRLAIANAELRFPLWGGFGGDNFYGPIPVELAFFTDAGVAWGRSQRAGFTEGDNQPVLSAGIAARINVFGFAVAEIDYVRPFDRPGRGWLWQFSFRPGF